MSLSYIDQPDSYNSLDSPRKQAKSHHTSQILTNKELSPQHLLVDKSKASLAPKPFRTTYIFPEVNLTKSDKQRVLLKLKGHYARKHPRFNMQKYMNTEIPHINENQLEAILHPEYEDRELIDKLKRQRLLKIHPKNQYETIPCRIDTNLFRAQPEREYSPVHSQTPYSSVPVTRTPEHITGNTYKGNAFITEQTEDSYDALDLKQGPRITTENSSTYRVNRSAVPHGFKSGPRLRWEHQSFHNTSKHSFMSFDMASETSKVSNVRGREEEIKIPKEYSVDKASRFRYLYQQFKDPQTRMKNSVRRLGSVEGPARTSGYGGFNKSFLEPMTKSRKMTLSKIDENKYEGGFGAPPHNAKLDLSLTVGDISETGRRYNALANKTNTLGDANEGVARDNLKRKMLNMTFVEGEKAQEKKEAYKRARKEHGRSKTNEFQSKPMDQSLLTLKTLFDDYANIKIDDGMKIPPPVTHWR